MTRTGGESGGLQWEADFSRQWETELPPEERALAEERERVAEVLRRERLRGIVCAAVFLAAAVAALVGQAVGGAGAVALAANALGVVGGCGALWLAVRGAGGAGRTGLWLMVGALLVTGVGQAF
ncbi:hypothetical protein GTY65_36435 [Streptomyces sp. SID8379]|uniref:hypothetical protein n=1 Tax=unclassified Streptomyces TaxID=2593676 RepID=UPI0003A74C07|nr:MULTISPECIES: hypothetical protein [unclassified Streptomyces]MYW69516.1 hypothetical protein [Streptomyces sp. SID8379]